MTEQEQAMFGMSRNDIRSQYLNGITAQFVATGSIQKVGLNVTIQA